MATLSWTTESLEQAFAIRHSSWNRIRVYLGPNAEDRATRYVVDTVMADMEEGMGVPHEAIWMEKPKEATQEQYDETYGWLQDNDYLSDWDVFDEARIAWRDDE
jgi:hypothetical protein